MIKYSLVLDYNSSGSPVKVYLSKSRRRNGRSTGLQLVGEFKGPRLKPLLVEATKAIYEDQDRNYVLS